MNTEKFVTEALRVHKAAQYANISIYHAVILGLLRTNGPQGVGWLAEQLGITQQAVGKALRVLGAQKEVTVTVDQADRRARTAEITFKGVTTLGHVLTGMA